METTLRKFFRGVKGFLRNAHQVPEGQMKRSMNMLIVNALLLAACARPSAADDLNSAAKQTSGLRARIFLADTSGEDAGRSKEVKPTRTFYDGQRFRLKVDSGRDGHLYVICLTSQEEVKLLYPRREGENFLTAGETQTLPERGWYRFDEEPGTEKLFFIRVDRPIAALERAAEAGLDPKMSEVRRYLNIGQRADKGIDFEEAAPRQNVLRIALRHESLP